jgi:hypothetical protein
MAALESIGVIRGLGLEMLTATVIVKIVKFRGLLINGDLPHAYLGSNVIFILEQLISIASLRESQERACL